MAFPWRLYGGAQRPDAISGLTPEFVAALERFYASAPPEVQAELGLNSAYRSPERQKELWDASDKTGRTVAAPGKSRHNHGDAVDLFGFGLGGGKTNLVSQATRDWVNKNAAAHGFYFPMDYEPWHMQWRGEAQGGGGSGGAMGPDMPKQLYNYTPEQRRKAIASIESAGSGDYGALGPIQSRSGDRAYGRYQIMGSNIPAWSKEVLGREITIDEFMRDPKIQDAIFDKKFGDYVSKYGESGAASMWFTGRPQRSDVKDSLGTTGNQYVDKYMAALGGPLSSTDNPAYTAPAGGGAGGAAVADGSGAVAPTQENKLETGLKDMASSIGGVFGAGASPLPMAQAAKPVATATVPEASMVLNPQAADAQRMKLAQAMARLNSGKLWV